MMVGKYIAEPDEDFASIRASVLGRAGVALGTKRKPKMFKSGAKDAQMKPKGDTKVDPNMDTFKSVHVEAASGAPAEDQSGQKWSQGCPNDAKRGNKSAPKHGHF